ncbi:MAG: flavodoxin [Cyclobacteriaceae bacterium]
MHIIRNIGWLLGLLQVLSLSACAQNEAKQEVPPVIEGSTLIVYLSRTNNTKAVAEMIQSEVGGELVALELKSPYPENYQEIVAQVDRENEEGFLPELKTKIDDIDKYDLIFLGFPTWDMQMPPPMKSFLTENDLSGKTVVPFNTNAGYGVGSGFRTVHELCPDANILEGYSTRGGIERDGILFVMEGEKEVEVRKEVHNWLARLKLL